MLLSNKIIIKWSERNKKYFEDKGYKYTGIGTLLEVYIKDLQHGSSINISIKCDYCGNIINKPYVRYINSVNNSVIKKDCCAKCQPLKNRETLMETHGVINVSQLKEVQEKTKKTNLERYGTQYILQNLEIREKEKELI